MGPNVMLRPSRWDDNLEGLFTVTLGHLHRGTQLMFTDLDVALRVGDSPDLYATSTTRRFASAFTSM